MTMQAMTGKTEGRHSTLDEVLAYIHKVDWRGSVPGLSRIDTLLGLLGHPERHVKYVHVTGTNGKGSTCAMLASVLRAAGYKTGLYTSPYIFRFNERMQINGAPIPDDTLCALVEELRPLADRMADPPTEFELVTAIGLTWFAREMCDIVVCEVGMGGEFDATNVIPAPEAAVLTSMGGILGVGCGIGLAEMMSHIMSTPVAISVQEVVAVRCRAAGAPLTVADFDALSSVCDTLEGQIFNYGPYKGLRLPLLGGHQLRNAAVALTTIDVLRQRGWHIDESAVRQGLAQTAWPGRFQVVRRQPTIILDGGHNPQCMVSLAAAIREYLPGQPVTVLTGVLADKDYGKMYDQLAPLAARFITVTPHNPRALDAGELAAFLRRCGKPVTACDTIREGVSRMLADTPPDGTAVCCGSLYLLGDVVQSLEKV